MPHSLLQALCQFPHRGAATTNEREAARLLADELTQRGATVRLEPFQTPKTYVTIVYWLIGGLLAGGLLVVSSGFLLQQMGLAVAMFFLTQSWAYFNWRPTLVSRWPVQHTALNVVGKWPLATSNVPADVPGPLVHVVLVAHYDTAPVSALYSPKQQRGFRQSLILSLLVMTVGVGLLFVYTFAPRMAWVGWSIGLVATYLLAQAVLGSIGYWARGYTNGASDNATGVVAAIETADRLRNVPGLLVEVLLPSAEEVGMLGSLAYVRKNRSKWPDGGQRTCVVNFDTLGAGKLTVVEQTGTLERLRYDNALTQLARQLIKHPQFRERTQLGRWHTADFDSAWFLRANVPTLALCALAPDGTMPRIHRPDDTLAAVDETPLRTAVDFAEAVVLAWMEG